MKLTKEEKIQCYEWALEALNNETNKRFRLRQYQHPKIDYKSYGVCALLFVGYKALEKTEGPFCVNNVLRINFNEIFEYKNSEHAFWLHTTENRIKVVTEILTKLKK